MDQIQRRDAGLPYISDERVMEQQKRARRLTQKLNTMDRADFDGLQAVARQLLATDQNVFLNPPFYCDYGDHIHVGKNFYANYNCTILDVTTVTFGDNCMLGPGVCIYGAGHPLYPDTRNTLYEYGAAVTVGDNVWIGGSSVVCPGVHIGSNTVIGAGSVVTRDIPAWSLAAGNPCRVLRPITPADRERYFKGRHFDPEGLQDLRSRLAEGEPAVFTLDVSEVETSGQLHALLAQKLGFPAFYGGNWDAFWDTVTGLTPLPGALAFIGWQGMALRLPRDSAILKKLLVRYYTEIAPCKDLARALQGLDL